MTSAFCLTDTHNHHTLVESGLYFKHTYPEVLLQDLPSGWYFTDYIAVETNKAICSCIAYESEYIDNGESLEEFVEGIINDLTRYLGTRDKDTLRAIMLLSKS